MSATCHPTCAYKSMGNGTPGGFDHKTGLPIPAEVASGFIGIYGQFPFEMSLSVAIQLWFNAREVTLTTPNGVFVIDVKHNFASDPPPPDSLTPVPYPPSPGSYSTQLHAFFYAEDPSTGMQFELTFGFLFTDGTGGYSMLFVFDDNSSAVSTYSAPGSPSVGTFYLLVNGGTVSADIRGTGTYGDVTAEITGTW